LARKRIPVLNVMVDAVTMSEAVHTVEGFIATPKPHLIATANAEMVMMAQKDKELAYILNQADLVVPDGAGVVWAARYNGYPIAERVAGFDLVQQLMMQAAKKKYRIYLFGGAPGIAEKAKLEAEAKYSGINIVGTRHGFFSPEEEAQIITSIQSAKTDILLVALGVPKQEKWLSKHLNDLKVPVAIGVGGTFDVMAGVMQRAPLWMQRANLEWLFRLFLQPQRVLRMLALPKFALRVLTGKKH